MQCLVLDTSLHPEFVGKPIIVGFTNPSNGLYQVYVDNIGLTANPIPEPSPFALCGAGALSLLAYAWHKRKIATQTPAYQ